MPQATVRDFGAVAALVDLARRLRLAEIIDRHLPKRGPGPSVGTYLLVAVLSCLPLLQVRPRPLVPAHRTPPHPTLPAVNASGTTGCLPNAIQAIERDLVAAMVRDFRVDLRHLLFDATNFFTFIDTFNDQSTLAQRGHSKEGRASLRIVGLALLVSADPTCPCCTPPIPATVPTPPPFRISAAGSPSAAAPSPTRPSGEEPEGLAGPHPLPRSARHPN